MSEPVHADLGEEALGRFSAVLAERPHYVWPPVISADAAALAAEYSRGPLRSQGTDEAVRAFEASFRDFHGTPYSVAMSSGTATLYAAYAALGLGPGDEVIVPAYGYHATVTPLLHLGATPVLCDIEPATGNIDPERIQQLITPCSRAVVVNHLWGGPAALDEIRNLR